MGRQGVDVAVESAARLALHHPQIRRERGGDVGGWVSMKAAHMLSGASGQGPPDCAEGRRHCAPPPVSDPTLAVGRVFVLTLSA
jgi:hypothetical protein